MPESPSIYHKWLLCGSLTANDSMVSSLDGEAERPLIGIHEEASVGKLPPRRTVPLTWFLACCTSFLFLSIFYIVSFSTSIRNDFCSRKLSTYSPALSAIEYYEYEWPNDFNENDIYRGPPTPEKDAAWKSLWEMGDIIIKKSELAQLNKSTETAKSMIKPALNGIAANLEVFHQLHCLDMIRRYTYLNSYTPESMPADLRDTPESYMREHIDHCITTLRLAVMCTSDVTPILMERDQENILDVLPDMRTSHKCRRFEKVQEWFLANAYTNHDCIMRDGIGCDIIPAEFKQSA